MTKIKSKLLPLYEFNNILGFAVCNHTAIVAIFPSEELAEDYIATNLYHSFDFFVRPYKITTRIVKPLKND